jgi:transcriptional regulator with XRE-family HTH domain
MPPQRKSKPRSPEHAALAKAIEYVIAQTDGMNRDKVSTDSGLSLRKISDLVRGQSNPTHASLRKLCKGLHTRPGELFTLADEIQDEGRVIKTHRLDSRITEEEYDLAKQAAAAGGERLSEFVRRAAHQTAERTLAERDSDSDSDSDSEA